MRKLVALLLAFILSTQIGLASSGQLIVVESNTKNFPAGYVMEAPKHITLAAGEQLNLVAEDGALLRLRGPFSGVPSAARAPIEENAGVVQALSRLFAAGQPSPSAWGTYRGNEGRHGSEAANIDEPWAWNIFRSDNICVPKGVTPTMWRSETEGRQQIVLLHLSTGAEAELELDSGQRSVAWPGTVPLLDGGEYAVRDAGNLWERKLLVYVIPDHVTGDVQQIAWMSDAGCLRQARLMITRLQ